MQTKLSGKTQVFAASAWWRNCDNFVMVAGIEQRAVEDAIRTAVEDELDTAIDQDMCADSTADESDVHARRESDLCQSGLHTHTIASLGLTESETAELETDGLTYYGL